MAWRKASQALVTLFDETLPDDPRVERRKMFGYPAAFTGGHLFAGLHQEDLILRLPADDRAEATCTIGARPFTPMPGRTMSGYVAVGDAQRHGPAGLRPWLARSFAFARSLPPKATKQPAGKRSVRSGARARPG